MQDVLARLLLVVLRIYRNFISPAIQIAFDVRCRYDESCSRYAERMVKENGALRGVALATIRFLSCNPWVSIKKDTVRRI
jgi:putative membrane protein insertion efficiency factor